jgi:putative iron-regulated protein
MRSKLTLWTANLSPALLICLSSSASTQISASEGGEGGEAGGAPQQYQLLLDASATPKYDATQTKANYVRLAFQRYRKSADAAAVLQTKLKALVQDPSAQKLQQARDAWVAARMAYLPSEVFRYYDGPIDRPAGEGPAGQSQAEGPEHRINSWPVNEAVIDYVKGNPNAGLVMKLSVPMTEQAVLDIDQVQDEADVTTGFHAIEFLLWGQDHSATAAGQRSHLDFVGNGSPANQRRGAMLVLLGQLLERDLRSVASAWDRSKPDQYAAQFLALNDYEAVGRMLRGMAMLAGEELQSERLTVPLDSATQEDETSCFSDTTHLDFRAGATGLQSVWQSGGSGSLRALVESKDKPLAATVDRALVEVVNAAQALEAPFDQMLVSAPDSRSRQKAEALASALGKLVTELKLVGRVLGVLVSAPGG